MLSIWRSATHNREYSPTPIPRALSPNSEGGYYLDVQFYHHWLPLVTRAGTCPSAVSFIARPNSLKKQCPPGTQDISSSCRAHHNLLPVTRSRVGDWSWRRKYGLVDCQLLIFPLILVPVHRPDFIQAQVDSTILFPTVLQLHQDTLWTTRFTFGWIGT